MITKKTFLTFTVLAFLSILVWIKFTYPQVAFINLTLDRNQAIRIASEYLQKERGENLALFKQSALFGTTRDHDQYLQKVLGYWGEIEFLKKYNYDLFYWTVRFYKETEKEQYYVTLSASTGEILGVSHEIKDTAARADSGEEAAKQKALTFLKHRFNFNPDLYVLINNSSHKYDNRKDYAFAWERKEVYIPWSKERDTGGAKLKTGVTVSGDEIRSFSKQRLDIPEGFFRHIAQQKTVGNNLTIIFRIIFLGLLTASIFFVIARWNNLAIHTVKNFCISLTIAIFIAHIIGYWNEFESIFFYYDTTSSFISYLWRSVTDNLLNIFLLTITIFTPFLAGELLRYEKAPQHKAGSFLHYIVSGIFTRQAAQLILLGYLVASIMIGLQAAIFEFGQRRLGVWVEYTWMVQLSSSYLPFLSALIIGFVASTTEEIIYRLFAINLGKKLFKSTILAALIASTIWGYGHSGYMVFPMWFRGVEVTLLGLLLSYVYLRYGLIVTIVAHYLFDVFWESSPYLLGQSNLFNFYSCLLVVLLPLGFAGVCFILNRPQLEQPLRWRLTLHQKFNLEVLKNYLQHNPSLLQKPRAQLVPEITRHGWDLAVVEYALDDLQKTT